MIAITSFCQFTERVIGIMSIIVVLGVYWAAKVWRSIQLYIQTHSKYSIQKTYGIRKVTWSSRDLLYKTNFYQCWHSPTSIIIQIKTLRIMIFLFYSKMKMLFNFPIMNNKKILHIVQYQVCNVLHHCQQYIVCICLCMCLKNIFNILLLEENVVYETISGMY